MSSPAVTPEPAESPQPPPRAHNRAFGWDLEGTIIDAEARIIRDTAARVVAGSSFSAEARRLQEEGVWSPGGQWYPARVSRMLTAPRVVGDRPPVRGGKPAGILDRVTYESLVIGAQERQRAKAGRFATGVAGLLSGLVFCARCGAPLKLSGRADRRGYRCPSNRRLDGGQVACGRIQVNQPGLDAFVTERALAWWAHDSAPARRNGSPGLAAARADLALVEEALVSYDAQYGAGLMTHEEFERLRRRATDRRASARTRVQRAEQTGLPEVEGEKIWDWWDTATLEERHALVGAVYPKLIVGPVTHPGPSRDGEGIDPGRVTTRDGQLLRLPPDPG